MQPKPELIRLSGYADSFPRLLPGLFIPSLRAVFFHHFREILCADRLLLDQVLPGGLHPVPRLLFSANNMASRKGAV